MRTKKLKVRLAGVALAALAFARAPVEAQAQVITEWSGGRWFDGARFEPRTVWTVGPMLTFRSPARVDRRIDLRGGYVTPAFGDAHHHGIDGATDLDAKIESFRCAGIFYVKNPNVIPDYLTGAVRARLDAPGGLDVAFALGGFTNPGGHPGPLHDRLAAAGVFPGLEPQDMAGRAFVEIASPDDVKSAWPGFLAGRPDFVKVFLNGGDRLSGEGGGTPDRLGDETLRALVDAAHGSGLRVTAHIETADDFALAVRAGVDELAHAPLVNPLAEDMSVFRISPADAELAAEHGVVVVLTASVLGRFAGDRWTSGMRTQVRNLQSENIRTLRSAGVPLAIGSDGISGEQPFVTARDEVRYLEAQGLLSNGDLLRAWSGITPATIFPDRRIGRLSEGYEADFLVLDGDPLQDFSVVDEIRLRVRQGEPLPACPNDPT